jgi:hypothetical protein
LDQLRNAPRFVDVLVDVPKEPEAKLVN